MSVWWMPALTESRLVMPRLPTADCVSWHLSHSSSGGMWLASDLRDAERDVRSANLATHHRRRLTALYCDRSSASGALYLDGNLHVLPGKTNACWDKLKKQFSHKTPALNTAAGTQVLCVRSEAGLVRDTSDVQTREIDQELNWRICAHYFSCFPSFSFRAVTRLQHQSLSLPFI